MAAVKPWATGRPSWAWWPSWLERLPGWRAHRRTGTTAYARVVTDTRRDPLPGALFVALRGARFDAHDYLETAIAGGVAGVVVERPDAVPAGAEVDVWVVADTRGALGDLARLRRRAFTGIVVAVTGSAGKSTTKRAIAAALGRSAWAAPGNWNNEVGVPLSLLSAPLDARFWVLEFGMNAPGEIGRLTLIAEPDLGVLLPAGLAHVGYLGSPEAVVAAKAELGRGAAAPPLLVVADDRYHAHIEVAEGVHRVGRDGQVEVVAARVHFPRGTDVVLREGRRRRHLRLQLHGAQHALPVAVAWSVARILGETPARIQRRLEGLAPLPGRMTLQPWCGGWLLDDAYNAAPEAFEAFCDYLEALPSALRRRVVLAEMLELGAHGPELHARLARRLARLELERIVVVEGPLAAACRAEGVPVEVQPDPDSAVAAALADWRPGVLLAAKGAQGTGLRTALLRATRGEA